MRNDEAKNLTKSLFIGVAFFATLAITPLIVNSFKSAPILAPDSGTTIYSPIDIPEIIPPVTTIVPPAVVESTVKIEIPTPTRNPIVETPPKSNIEIKNTKIGTENVVGTPSVIPTTTVVTPTTTVAPPVVVPKPVDNTPITVVDIEASFNGGINAFRSKVVQNFSTGNFEGTGDLLKTTVTFIVEKDGTISAISANGTDAKFNKEAEKTIKNIKGKWAPAKLNGQNVRSYFKFPIAMQFE
jgi:protein TonB